MMTLTKTLLALIIGGSVLGSAIATADYRPAYCPVRHDHRAHDANYYNYYPRQNYDQRSYRRGYDYAKPRSEVVHRNTYNTRYRARVTVVEEIYYTRSGRKQLVCSIVPKGPEAYYIPRERLERFAYKGCSKYARIQYL